MNDLSATLKPMTDEDVEVLWECFGLHVEDLEEMKHDHDEQAKTHTNSRTH